MKRIRIRNVKKNKQSLNIIISVRDVEKCNSSFHFTTDKINMLSIKENVINNIYRECIKNE